LTDITQNGYLPHPPAPSPREERGREQNSEKFLFPAPFGRGARGEGLKLFDVR